MSVLNFPKDLQFIARTSENIGYAEFAVFLGSRKPEELSVELYENNLLSKRFSYATNKDSLHIRLPFNAGLIEHGLILKEKTEGKVSIVARADNMLCGDAFLFYGQSNALALGQANELNTASVKKWVRNFVATDPITNGWKTGNFPEIGTLGKQLCLRLIDSLNVPVLIINGAKGGLPLRALYDRNEANPLQSNTNYGNFLSRARYSGINRWRGFIWYQGEEESAGNEENIENYPALFDAFKRSIEQDIPAIDRFYVFQLNIMGVHQQWLAGRFREYQRQLPLQYPNLSLIPSLGVSSPFFDGIHYEKTGHGIFADRLYQALLNHSYSTTKLTQREAAQIRKVIHFEKEKSLKLVFDEGQNLSFQNKSLWPNTSLVPENDFYLNQQSGFVKSLSVSDNIVELNYSELSADLLTYLPGYVQEPGKISFEGPLLFNEFGIPAFSFSDFPITPSLPDLLLSWFDFESQTVSISFDETFYTNCESCSIVLYSDPVSDRPKIIKPIDYKSFKISKSDLNLDKDGNFTLHFRVISDSSESTFYRLFVTDSDKDGLYDQEDNCPYVLNPDQKDFDSDLQGDVCDADSDGDGLINEEDDCALYVNPSKPIISSANGYELETITGNSLEWYFNGEMLNQVSSSIFAGNSGEYRVRQRDAEGCYSAFSEIYLVTLLSTNESSSMLIYPNPAENVVRLSFPRNMEGKLELFTSSGQRVESYPVHNQNSFDLHINDLPAGGYYLRVIEKDTSEVFHRRFQKK